MFLYSFKRDAINSVQITHRPERASLLDADANPRSAQELARPVDAVVVEAGAVGRVLLTRESATDGRRNA